MQTLLGRCTLCAVINQTLHQHAGKELAELKAIQSSGPKELQQIASDATSKVEKHLEKAKQLAKKLEDDRKNSEG